VFAAPGVPRHAPAPTRYKILVARARPRVSAAELFLFLLCFFPFISSFLRCTPFLSLSFSFCLDFSLCSPPEQERARSCSECAVSAADPARTRDAASPAARRPRADGVRMQQPAVSVVNPEERMAALKITLPEPAPAAANYVPYVVAGNFIYIAGQIPLRDGQLVHKGRVPSQATTAEAYQSARLCGTFSKVVAIVAFYGKCTRH